jgi:quercetin dioxygenase-like cupin family protein
MDEQITHPFSQINKGNKLIRTFTPDVDESELKWHQDLLDREVLIIKSGGWKYQEDDKLPILLNEGMTILIPKMTWHRVIKGIGELIVEISEK